jgi:hypothetical protein
VQVLGKHAAGRHTPAGRQRAAFDEPLDLDAQLLL